VPALVKQWIASLPLFRRETSPPVAIEEVSPAAAIEASAPKNRADME
jgi:hypothetical protein